MRTIRFPGLGLAAVFSLSALMLTGCGESMTAADGTASVSTDQDAIGLLISEDQDSFGTQVEMSTEDIASQRALDVGRTGLDGQPLDSFYFRRIIRSQDVSRDIHIEHPAEGPAIAEVTVTRDLHGIFRLFYKDPDQFLPATLDKRLEATAQRNAVFMKRGGDHRHRGWRLVEVSGIEVASNPTTKMIRSVEIRSASVQMTITDPLQLMPVSELPTFAPNEEVTLTVTTDDASDFVFLHTHGRKREFEALGEGVFRGTWVTGDGRARGRVAIDVIDEATLLDDDAPYDSVIWGLIYRIARPGDEAPVDQPTVVDEATDGPTDAVQSQDG
jgi:hypothetical protein